MPKSAGGRRFDVRSSIHLGCVTVHGVELSGMSKNVVPPPAASAWLPVSAPSQ